MILGKLSKELDGILLKDTAYSWDNVGLLIGDVDNNVNKITLALELCDEVIDDAINDGSNLILTHHPLIFSPIKSIVSTDLKQKWMIKLIKNNIALYTAHTNFDMIEGGLNDYVISMLDVKDISNLLDEEEGFLGRLGTLNIPMQLDEFFVYLQEKLKIKDARLIAKTNRKVEKIALITGSGAEFINIATSKADVYITGDLKYHEAQDLYQGNLAVIDAGHYGTEKHFGNAMKRYLKNKLSEEIEIFISTSLDNPFKQVSEGL